MTNTDPQIIEFIKLIDVAIASTEQLKMNSENSKLVKNIDEAIQNLKAFCSMAISGKLPSPSRGDVPEGAGLGLTRGIGEWAEDGNLLDAVYAVENYYKKQM